MTSCRFEQQKEERSPIRAEPERYKLHSKQSFFQNKKITDLKTFEFVAFDSARDVSSLLSGLGRFCSCSTTRSQRSRPSAFRGRRIDPPAFVRDQSQNSPRSSSLEPRASRRTARSGRASFHHYSRRRRAKRGETLELITYLLPIERAGRWRNQQRW